MSIPAGERAARPNSIREVFEPGRPLTYIRSTEELRVARVLREVTGRRSGATPAAVWTWSLTEGMHRDGERAAETTRDPRSALEFIAAHGEPAIFHLKDFHEAMRDSADIRRRLRDLYESCLDRRKFVVITSKRVRFIPEEVESAASCTWNCVHRMLWNSWISCAKKRRACRPDQIAAMRCCIRWRAPCRGSRWTKRGMRCGARWPIIRNWGPHRYLSCWKKSGC